MGWEQVVFPLTSFSECQGTIVNFDCCETFLHTNSTEEASVRNFINQYISGSFFDTVDIPYNPEYTTVYENEGYVLQVTRTYHGGQSAGPGIKLYFKFPDSSSDVILQSNYASSGKLYAKIALAINEDTGQGVCTIGNYLYGGAAYFAYVIPSETEPSQTTYTRLYEWITNAKPGPPKPQGDATCKVNYYLQDDEYTYSKITFKEDTPPIDMNDGYVQDILASQSSVNIENLVEGQKYYFTIFTNKSESESFPYIVGPVITDWVNAELPSPMVTALSTKPYKYENQEAISEVMSNYDVEKLGYDLSDSTKDLYNNIIPTGSSSRAFWIFGNNQRGLYVYYVNENRQAYIHMKAYYKNTVLFDERLEWLASARSARQGRVYVGKNDITKKGSIFFISYPTNWLTPNNVRIVTLLENDSTTYYFITNRPNPADYEWYINQINGTGFSWKDLERNSGSGYNKYPFSDYSQWRSDNGSTGDFNIKSNGDAYVFQTEKSRIDIVSTDYVTYSAILNPVNPFEGEYYDSFSTYGYYTVGRCRYNSKYQYVIQGMTNEVNGYPYTATGTLEEVLDAIRLRCRNVSIYVNGDCWSEV